MAKTVTPSTITQGQIGKIQELLGAGLRKSGFSCEPVQQVLEIQGDLLVTEMVSVVRRRVEAASNMVVRRVRVNRCRTPEQVIEATGRHQRINPNVVNAWPCGNGEEVEVWFFKLDRYISDPDLDREFELRGFKPADPYSIAAVNEADPAFADGHPNCTHWKDASGNWCYTAFYRWGGGRSVGVGRNSSGWGGHWWFAGLRK